MFLKVRNRARRAAEKARESAVSACVKVQMAKSGELYIDTAAKVLIACVIGMLILVSFYALYKNNIIPNVTNKTNDMFNYSA